YYLNENGQMQTSDLNIDGILFRFNKNGELQLD
ncbi:Surface protein PspC, partial [human gut metagenome]